MVEDFITLAFPAGLTALMIASIYGRYDEAAALLEKGSQVDLRDRNGWSALMHAVQGGHLEVVKLLLEHGANVDLQTLTWESALSLALEQENPGMLTLIKVGMHVVVYVCMYNIINFIYLERRL